MKSDNLVFNLDSLEILESISDVFFSLDKSHNFTFLNKKAEHFFEADRKDLVGKNIWEKYPNLKETALFDKFTNAPLKSKFIALKLYIPQLSAWFSIKIYPYKNGYSFFFQDITKEKNIENTLKSSEIKYRNLFETMQQGVVYHNSKGEIIAANPAAERILGQTLDQLKGKNSIDPMWKTVREDESNFPGEQHPTMVALKKKRKVKNVVMGVFNPIEFDYKWLLVSAVPLFNNGDKEPYEVYASFEDITSIKKFEKALIELKRQKDESITLLDALLSNAPVGFTFFDREYRYVKINKFLAELNGIPVEKHIGQSIKDLLPINAKSIVPNIDKVYSTGKPVQNIEIEGETPLEPGVSRYWLTSFYPVFDLSSKEIKYVGTVVTEITDRKRALAAVSRSERLLRDILNNIFSFVGLLTPEGILIEANKAPLELANLKPDDVLHKPFQETFWWSYSEESKNELSKALAFVRQGNALRYDIEIRSGNNKFITIDFALAPVYDDSGKIKYIVASGIDITERKALEQRKDEFIGIASHELKTPLTSIKGYVQILEKIIHQMGDEKLNLYLSKTNDYIDHLNSLIADLLDVSKIQAGKLQMTYTSYNFNEMVCDVIDTLQYTNKKHKLIKEGDVNIKIEADKYRVEQVLTNLLTNAIKYSPKARKVIIKISKKNGYVVVGVKDFGIGINKDQQEKIFSRFYRVDETAKNFSGLGIGLYISHEIVERHGGKMWVESEVNKGSTFYFTLPIKQSRK